MSKNYTRVCNFYFGTKSKDLVKQKKALPIGGNSQISFDKIEIITRSYKKKISINKINKLPKNVKKSLKKDIKLITKKKRFKYLDFRITPGIMGVLNVTPDSFYDGGKYNHIYLA